MKKTYLLLLALIVSTGLTYAQSSDKEWGVGIMIGENQYIGDRGNSVFRFNEKIYGFGGLSVNKYLNPSFNAGLQVSYGIYGLTKNDNTVFKGKKSDGSLLLTYKFNNGYILPEDSKIQPFASIGVGFNHCTGDNIRNGKSITLPIALGAKYQLSEQVALQYQFLFQTTNSDQRDGVRAGSNDHFAQQSIGAVFSFGGPKDADGDGVMNGIDTCPETPAGVEVNELGCPVDNDGDGTPDYLDNCPTVFGAGDFMGCPDTDGDGVEDSKDKCPKVKGSADFMGCPDTDGDGVEDSKDECPKIKGLAQFNGCLDSDGDGVADNKDECPNVAGLANLNGCPDSDGDGIADKKDLCPNEAGLLKNKGCPDLNEEEQKVLKEALEGVNFLSGKDILTNDSKPKLDNVAHILSQHSSYTLQVSGYTDSSGDETANLKLSERRANAVKTYLIGDGIDGSRITATGYGEASPIADNATKAGRAKNRRVEFKVGFE